MGIDAEYIAALVSTATVSLLHSLLPSHWLCFSLAGKARGWSLGKTLGITAAAGFSHVLSTLALGILVILLGRRIFPAESVELVSSLILLGMGALFLLLQFIGKGHRHEHDLDRLALLGLILTPTLSPCAAVIPMFFAVSQAGVLVITLTAGVLLISTLGTMLLLVALTSLGVERFKFTFVDRYEKALIGSILLLLGLLILVFHDHDHGVEDSRQPALPVDDRRHTGLQTPSNPLPEGELHRPCGIPVGAGFADERRETDPRFLRTGQRRWDMIAIATREKLVFRNGPLEGREFPFRRSLRVGRGAGSDLLVADRTLSRTHCTFYHKDGRPFVQDLDSTNGTRVNGETVLITRELAPGDVITAGDIEIEYVETE